MALFSGSFFFKRSIVTIGFEHHWLAFRVSSLCPQVSKVFFYIQVVDTARDETPDGTFTVSLTAFE